MYTIMTTRNPPAKCQLRSSAHNMISLLIHPLNHYQVPRPGSGALGSQVNNIIIFLQIVGLLSNPPYIATTAYSSLEICLLGNFPYVSRCYINFCTGCARCAGSRSLSLALQAWIIKLSLRTLSMRTTLTLVHVGDLGLKFVQKNT